VLFEFTDSDDPDIGNVVGAPAIAKFRTRSVKGVAETKYFVVVSGGFNSYADDGIGRFNPAAPGVLFLLSLDKKPSAKWALNVNYYKFAVPAADPARPYGLGPAALVTGNDGAVLYAYAGDLQGSLWRFNFTAAAPWSKALGADPPTPLFVAADGANARQPVTMQPRVVFAPQGGYVVLFGTGKFVEEADAAAANFRTQSFYGIHDTTQDAYRVAGRGELAPRSASKATDGHGDSVEVAGNGFDYGAPPAGKRGWYLDFMMSDTTGERAVREPSLSDGRVAFSTLIPGSDRCAGGARTYVLDALTGLTGGVDANGLLLQGPAFARPMLIETAMQAQDGAAFNRPAIRKRYFAAKPALEGGSSGVIVPLQQDNNGNKSSSARLGWRELINWQELHDAISGK
jgi:type IV pilus assembly protein PilY1